MKMMVTLLIQRDIEAKDQKDYEKQLGQASKAIEKLGWVVGSVEDETDLEKW